MNILIIKSLEIPPQASPVQGEEVQKWTRPKVNCMKLNCDGALNIAGAVAATGVVVRNNMGSFVAAEGRRYQHVIDPGITELLACRDAVFMARARGWTHVEVETDCQSVVTAWTNDKEQRSAGFPLVLEMKSCISTFQGFSFSFVRRTANKAAHACAREALSLGSPDMLYETAPGFLIDIIQSNRLSSYE